MGQKPVVKQDRGKKFNILVVLLYWYPYSGPHTPIYAGLFRDLKKRGHKITIVTSFPHFRSGSEDTWDEFRGKLYEKAQWEGIDLVRTLVFAPTFKKKRLALVFRALNFISFSLSSLMVGILLPQKYDIVLTLSSPPLANGLVGWLISRTKGAKSVHNIVDLYPDMAQKVGIWDNKAIMYALKKIELLVYRLSDKIVVLSDNMKKKLVKKGVSKDKVDVIPDFIDIEGIFPKPKENEFSRKYNLLNHTVVLYAGNIGIPHGVEVLIETAELMRSDEDVLFCIVGRGENKDKIVEMAKRKNLSNVVFVPRQPDEMVPYIWSSADISVVTYKRGLSEYSVPSKLLYIMASHRPVIVTADVGSDTRFIVNDAKCGINIDPENPHALKEAISHLKEHPERMKELGKNGHDYVKQNFERHVVSDKFEALFHTAIIK
jgi:glycosyltransferase involved in cell wall biosynthesis